MRNAAIWVGIVALVLGTGVVRAQVVGGGIAPTSGATNEPSIAPPASDLMDEPGKKGLAPVRGDQPLTTNAMLGFVNSEPVFVQDVFRPIDDNLRALAKNSRTLSEFRKAATPVIQNQLKSYVGEKLIVTAAEKTLTDQDRAKIDMYMAVQKHKLITTYGGSVPAADKALAAQGSSLEKKMADERRKVIMQMYWGKNMAPKVVITRQMVLDAYERDPKRWQEEAEVELYTITLPVSRWLREPGQGGKLGPMIDHPTPAQVKAAEAQALTTAREIVGKIKAGGDFALLVEDYGSRDPAARTGGRTANLKRGSLLNLKLEDYIFSLPADTVGEPQLYTNADPALETVVVVKIGTKKEARTVPFSEAQEKIKEMLRMKQMQDLQEEEMAKLYKDAAIEAVDRMSDVAVDAAVARYVTQ